MPFGKFFVQTYIRFYHNHKKKKTRYVYSYQLKNRLNRNYGFPQLDYYKKWRNRNDLPVFSIFSFDCKPREFFFRFVFVHKIFEFLLHFALAVPFVLPCLIRILAKQAKRTVLFKISLSHPLCRCYGKMKMMGYLITIHTSILFSSMK